MHKEIEIYKTHGGKEVLESMDNSPKKYNYPIELKEGYIVKYKDGRLGLVRCLGNGEIYIAHNEWWSFQKLSRWDSNFQIIVNNDDPDVDVEKAHAEMDIIAIYGYPRNSVELNTFSIGENIGDCRLNIRARDCLWKYKYNAMVNISTDELINELRKRGYSGNLSENEPAKIEQPSNKSSSGEYHIPDKIY